jgi:hypothetical protein
MVSLEVDHGDSRWQESQAGDFQTVIEDGTPGDGLVAVADRIDKGFSQGRWHLRAVSGISTGGGLLRLLFHPTTAGLPSPMVRADIGAFQTDSVIADP